ncbi:MAG: AbrB/MazE/SpoVT family DNA-binding domain-containing protein [Terracidiphilus sp.]
MSTEIARIGNTIAVAIPEELLEKANLSVGDRVEWVLTPNGELALVGASGGEEHGATAGYENWKAAEIEAGLAEMDSGESVPSEKVNEWLRSWGTTRELPPPL